MRTSPLRWTLLGLALFVVSAVGGYAIAAVVDDDGGARSSERQTGPSTTTPDGAPQATGRQPPDGQTVVASALGILGWWDGGRWVANDGAAPPVDPGLGFTFLPLAGPPAAAIGGPLGTTCEIATGQRFVELTPPFSGTNVVAVSGVGRPFPRRVEPLDRASATYQTAAAEALATVGITDAKPDLTQLLRVDLDGDGSDEVLVGAERRSGAELIDAEDGDYSAVLVRRLAGRDVRTQVLNHHVGEDDGSGGVVFLRQYRVAAVADLNGDGTLEVAIASDYYEGADLEVFTGAPGGDLRSVLAVGCGA